MIEPSAESRIYAKVVRDFYIAYINEGFTEEQAMRLLESQVRQG